jgi:hypothetical protein
MGYRIVLYTEGKQEKPVVPLLATQGIEKPGKELEVALKLLTAIDIMKATYTN